MKRIVSLFLSFVMLISIVTGIDFSAYAETITNDDYEYILLDDGTIEITSYVGGYSSLGINIPSKIGGYPVSSIGNDAFNDFAGLTSITIPDGVVSIGDRAFLYCISLKNVVVPDSVVSIGESAFSHCYSLNDILIPDAVIRLGSNSFSYCDKLTSVIIGDAVISIEDETFRNCENLTNVTIGNSVTSIGDRVFLYCESLENIIIPDSVISIGNSAFSECRNLANIRMSDNLTSIGEHSFQSCESLKSIRISHSVTNIGVSAFISSGLTNVIIESGVTSIGDLAFEDCDNLASIAIPNSATNIGQDAFYSCDGLTSIVIENPECEIYDSELTISNTAVIYGYENSTAQTYAQKYNRTFVPLDSFSIIKITGFGYFTQNEGELYIDDENSIVGNFQSAEYTENDIKWTCDNTDVLQLGNPTYTPLSNYDKTHNCSFGIPIKALSEGSATVTGVLPDGISASYTVIVLKDKYDIDVDFGDGLQIDKNNQVVFSVAVTKNDEIYDSQDNISVVSNNRKVLEFNRAEYNSDTKYTKLYFDYKADGIAEIYINQENTNAETLLKLNISNEYVKEHIDFINSKYESQLTDARYAKIIQDNLNSPSREVAGYCYDVINGTNKILSFDFKGFENPYEIIFSDYITNQATLDALEKSYDAEYGKFVLSNFNKVKKFTKKYWESDWNEKSDTKMLEKLLNGESVSDEFTNKFEKIFSQNDSALTEYFNCLGVAIDAINEVKSLFDTGKKIGDCIKDVYDYANTIDAYNSAQNEFKLTLDAAVQHACETNYQYGQLMKEVVDKYKAYATEDYWIQIIKDGCDIGLKLSNDLFGTVIFGGFVKVIKNGLDLSSAALACISAATVGFKTGFALQEFLTNNGDIHQCQELLKANYHFEKALYDLYVGTRQALISEPTIDNAKLYDSAYNLLKQAEVYSLNVYTKELKYEQHSLFGTLIHFSNSYNNTEIQKAQSIALWWQAMRCHMTVNASGVSLITVACPTNVYVYKFANGVELVGKVENGVATNISSEVLCGVIGDTKYISVPNTKDYIVITTATDNGKMDFIVSNYDSDMNFEKTYGYKSVTLEKGNSYGAADYEGDYALIDMQTQEAITSKDIDTTDDNYIAIEKIIIDSEKSTINVGEKIKLNAIVEPVNSTVQTFRWSSSNPNVASVDEDGNVTGLSYGSAVITATNVINDNVKAEYTVKVVNKHIIDIDKDECFEYKILEDDTIEITGYHGNAKDLTIPSEIDGKSVISIGEETFKSLEDLESVVISEGITTIKYNAFAYCSNLKHLTIPASVSEIADWVFTDCNNLVDLYYTGTIEDWCNISFSEYDSNPNCYATNFYINNELVTDLVIPDSVTEIKKYSFKGCSNIKSIILPDNIISIGEGAFYDCNALTNITIPDSVNIIGDYAFYRCYNLSNIVMSDNINSIGINAFYSCSDLKSIILSENIINIASGAFDGCWQLDTVYYRGTQEKWENIVVEWGNDYLLNATIHYDFTTFEEHFNMVESVEETCTEDGYNKYDCLCGYEKKEILPSGHKKELVNKVESIDCANPGYSVYYCSRCNQTYNDDYIYMEHNYSQTIVSPTCDAKGYTIEECTVCGDTYYYGYIDAIGHNYIDGICSRCDKEELVIILNENLNVNIEKAGYIELITFIPEESGTYYFYSDTTFDTYGYLYDSEMNLLALDDDSGNGSNFLISYSFEAGKTYYLSAKYYNSSNTGSFYIGLYDSYTDGHNWNYAKTVSPTTCTDGYDEYICELCDQTKVMNVVSAYGHSYLTEIIEPTCTQEGYTNYYCEICGYSYSTDYVDATGVHTYVNGFCKYCHTKDNDYTLPTISSGETKTVNIANGDDYCYFSFTPETDGNYIFSSDSDSDTYGYLYDFDMNELYSDDDSGRNTNFLINYNFEAGKTYIFGFRYFSSDATGSFDVSLNENCVASISYTPFEPIEIIENSCGYWDEFWVQDEYEDGHYEKFYHYYTPCFNYGDVFTVTDKDGSSVDYIFNDENNSFISEDGNKIEGDLLNRNSVDQHFSPWTISGENYFTIEYMGAEARVPVTIVENNHVHHYISEIFEPTCSQEGYTRYFCEECGDSYSGDYVEATGVHTYVNGFCKFCNAKDEDYILPIISVGKIKTVDIENCGDYYYFSFTPEIDGNYIFSSNSDADTYGYLYDSNMNELTNNDDSGNDGDFLIRYDFEAGKTYIFGCRYYSSENIGSFDVSLIENPVASISYTPINQIEIIENTHGYWAENDNGEAFYRYNTPSFILGDMLTITNKDGNSVDYIFNQDEYSFISEDGDVIYGDLLNCISNQYSNHWTFGGENYFIVEYLGVMVQVPVTIVKNIDKDALSAAIEKFNELNSADYSETSYNNLKNVVDNHKSLLDTAQSQEDVDRAVTEILEAIYDLEPYFNFTVSSENGSYEVTCDGSTSSGNKYSLLFGTEITVSATANEGYEFVGWYDVTNNLYFSKESTYTFKITSNTNLKAVCAKKQSATLTFTTYSNWVQSTVTKTVDEWNGMTSIDDLLPEVPYKYGYSNGRWVYDNDEVLAKLRAGEGVFLIPEYDEDDTSLPTPREPENGEPALDLYYKLDAYANVGSFVMTAEIPDDCQIESVGVAFYYKKANEFDPTKFELLNNNKMLVSRFNTEEIEDIYIVNMNKLTSTYNWAVRGYVIYYDADGNLKTAYSNQVNIVNREQV